MDGSDDNDLLEGLEERLKSHSRAFESLLALTPARDYYGSHVVDGQDPSEQWTRKKQTKEQKRAAKKAKLDPANQKSALDIMKEREADALKRKRGEQPDGEGAEDEEEIDPSSKRQRSEEDADATEARRREKAEKKKEARIRKKEKRDAKKAKLEAKKTRKQERKLAEETNLAEDGGIALKEGKDEDGDDQTNGGSDLEEMDITGLAELGDEQVVDLEGAESDVSSAPTTPVIDSPAFDTATSVSAASSSSSIIPPSIAASDKVPQQKLATITSIVDTALPPPDCTLATSSKSKDPPSGIASPKIQLPNIDHAVLQERLRQRIEALRAERKADGGDGSPAKSRQELLEQRRKKEEQRKAAKKDQIRKAKEDEKRKQEERLRGSGSPLGADMFSPRSPQARENNFSFSRLAFEDGATTDAGLTGLHDAKKRKGPQDPKTALQAAQAKQARLAGLDAGKRADIAEKDMWLNASKRAHGERVRDDTSLLKKALKRKEKAKGKSEALWKEREQAVVKGKEMKQKKRETNLQKRRDEKGGKGKKKGGAKGGPKKKSRPGFEGRFKA